MPQLELLRAGLSLLASLGILGGGGALLFAVLLPRAPEPALRLARHLAFAGSGLALLALPLRLGLDVVFLGGGWTAGLDPALWEVVLTSPAGQAAQVQAGGLLLLLAGTAVPPLRRLVGLPGLLAALAGFALLGHTADLQPTWLAQALLLVHLAGLAFWLGSLWPLLRCTEAPPDQAAAAMERFSRQATWAVPLLLAAGLALVVWLVGRPEALVDTLYGRLLLAKLAGVAVLLALASANKLRFVPRLCRGDPAAAGRLATAIRLELLLAVGVLAATALLTSLAGPPT